MNLIYFLIHCKALYHDEISDVSVGLITKISSPFFMLILSTVSVISSIFKSFNENFALHSNNFPRFGCSSCSQANKTSKIIKNINI